MSSEKHDLLKDTVEVIKHLGESAAPKAGVGGGVFTISYDWFTSGFTGLSSVGAIGLILTVLSITISFMSYRLRLRVTQAEVRRKEELHELEMRMLRKRLEGEL